MSKGSKRKSAKKAVPVAGIAAAIILVAIAGALLAFALWPRPLRVGFYDIDPSLAGSITKVVEDWSRADKIPVRVVPSQLRSLDAKSVRSADAIFMYPSRPNKAESATFEDVAPSLSDMVANPLARSVASGDRHWALPILVDTDEIAWKKNFARAELSSATLRISNFDGVSANRPTPIVSVIAGGDDERLLDAVGFLVLESGGRVAYENLCDATLSGSASMDEILDRDLSGTTVRLSLESLFRYMKNRAIHQNWLDIDSSDMIALVDASLAGIAVQDLSTHRKESREVLSQWDSAPIVITSPSGLPCAFASVLCLARVRTKRAAEPYDRLAAYLISGDGQRALQSATRLAPASASAQADDIQATAARAAVSGANVLQGFARDGFRTPASRSEFAAAIRQYLRSR